MTFSDNQIVRLRGIMGENTRPVQARNGRYLLQSIGGYTVTKRHLSVIALPLFASAYSLHTLPYVGAVMGPSEPKTMESATASGAKADPMRLDNIAFADA